MTAADRFEGDLPRLLAELVDPGPPDEVSEVLVRTADLRQRRSWTILERWIPTGLLAGPDAGAPRVPLRLVGLLVLIIVLVGMNLLGVATPGPGGPGPSPSASTPSPSASPSPPPTPPLTAVTGPLEAGAYRITNSLHTMRPFTFTVPDGWRYDENFLSKGDVFEGNGVTMATWVVSHIYRDSCQWEGTLRETTSVAEVVQALTEQTGHESTEPSATTFAGYPATRLELSLPADADLSGCDGQFVRLWPDAGPKEQYGLPIDPGQTTTVYIVDLDGRPALIVAISTETSTAADVAELKQVVESIRFE